MDAVIRRRHDPRRAATQTHLIEVAERLFAIHGVAGVSLRQIGAAAGSANASVVGYHFGSKEGLLRAIFEYRLGPLEEARAALLAKARAEGKDGDLLTLLHAAYMPLAQQRDHDGRRSYAAFVAGLQRFNEVAIRVDQSSAPTPVTDELAALVRKAMPDIPERAKIRRTRMTLMMICDTLALLDNHFGGSAHADDHAAVADLLNMVAGALSAPQASAEGS